MHRFSPSILILVTASLVLGITGCDSETDQDSIVGEWLFLQRTTGLYLTSSVDQSVFNSFKSADGSLEVRGKYVADLKQLMITYNDTTNTRLFFFYLGAPWQLAPPQLTIIETDGVFSVEFIYYSSDDFDSEIYETFHPEEVQFSYNLEEGVFELPLTTFLSDSGEGEVTIEGQLKFHTTQLVENRSILFSGDSSKHNRDEVEKFQFADDGQICAYFVENYYTDTLCGTWNLTDDQLTYNLSNGRHREYTVLVEGDMLQLIANEDCELNPSGENILWISESPDAINEICFRESQWFNRE